MQIPLPLIKIFDNLVALVPSARISLWKSRMNQIERQSNQTNISRSLDTACKIIKLNITAQINYYIQFNSIFQNNRQITIEASQSAVKLLVSTQNDGNRSANALINKF